MARVINGFEVTKSNQQSVVLRQVVLRPVLRPITVMLPKVIELAGGTFPMGSTKWRDAQPVRQVTISSFAMGQYALTNAEYLVFLQVMGKQSRKDMAKKGFAMYPANISWYEANEYCAFLREITKTDDGVFRNFGIPTEAQWEYAARGPEGREYPWGNNWDPSRVNFNSGGTTRVDKFASGATPTGLFGMAGNVWEWTADWYDDKYDPNDLVDPKGPEKGMFKVRRGGSWSLNNQDFLSGSYRNYYDPETQYNLIGFRPAED